MQTFISAAAIVSLAALTACATAGAPAPEPAANPAPAYDADLAARLGADEYGMRRYVLAILMTGPEDATITDAATRQALFQGHFANMQRLADEGHLILAGPLGGEDGRRGLFLLNTDDIAEATVWAETDPAVEAGIFTLSYSVYYGSAALQMVDGIHQTIQSRSIMD